MNACNCCEQFPIDVITLQSRSRGFFIGRCSYYNEDDGKLYKKVTRIYEDPWQEDEGWLGSETITVISTKTWSPRNIIDGFDTCSENIEYIPDISSFPPPYDDASTFQNLLETIWEDEETIQEIEDRYDLLIGLFPEFSEWQNINQPINAENRHFFGIIEDHYSSSYPDNSSISESEMRITHPPTASGYLKVWLLKRTYQWTRTEIQIGQFSYPFFDWEYLMDEPFQIYEWTGQPQSLSHGINEEENKIFSQVWNVTAETNKLTEIYIQKFSLIDGYEPDDPIVNEVNYWFERPSPDCESNGVPTLNIECGFRQ